MASPDDCEECAECGSQFGYYSFEYNEALCEECESGRAEDDAYDALAEYLEAEEDKNADAQGS